MAGIWFVRGLVLCLPPSRHALYNFHTTARHNPILIQIQERGKNCTEESYKEYPFAWEQEVLHCLRLVGLVVIQYVQKVLSILI